MPSHLDRQNEILELLEERRRLSVSAIAAAVYASEPTVRRDLAALAEAGLIQRIHGGAAALSAPDKTIPESVRAEERRDAKERIAAEAASLIRDGMVIFLDGSTSAACLVPHLNRSAGLIVITSGARTAVRLAEQGIRTVSTGGEILTDTYSLVGHQAERTVASFRADLCFFSCRAVGDDGEISDISMQENELRRAMIDRSERSILLADSSKLHTHAFHRLASLSELHGFLCDVPTPALSAMLKH